MLDLTAKEREVLLDVWSRLDTDWIGPPWEEYSSEFSEDAASYNALNSLQMQKLVKTEVRAEQVKIKLTASGFLYLPEETQKEARKHADTVMKGIKALFKKFKGKPSIRAEDIAAHTTLGAKEVLQASRLLSEFGFGITPAWSIESKGILDTVSVHSQISTVADFEALYQARLQEHEANLAEIKRLQGIVNAPIPAPKPEKKRDLNAEEMFDKLVIHPEIVKVSRDLFRDKYYSLAIFEACKRLNNLVRDKSGYTSKDGQSLMAHVFSDAAPVLKLNKLLSISDKSEQQGFMFLYMGTMAGIRNPKAHDNVDLTDPMRALKYLGLIDLLALRNEEATK